LFAEYFQFSGHFTGRKVKDKNNALPGYYSASSGNFLPMFLDDLSVPFSRVKNPKIFFWLENAFSYSCIQKGVCIFDP